MHTSVSTPCFEISIQVLFYEIFPMIMRRKYKEKSFNLYARRTRLFYNWIHRCLLNKKAKAVMKVITDIFGLILKFRNQLVSRPWQKMKTQKQNGRGDGHVQHPGFLDMCATYTSFQEYSLFLFKGTFIRIHVWLEMVGCVYFQVDEVAF